ncbi:integrase core domain-containing protein [Nannocystis punicea]|uniref:Integrase core domain-containing protein n=1 Tax=Nannocystis punicea TaxID=2995304 RepID=A0ABY7HKK2_9BACT|nr:integrase core domain-containing protein [Nannocystis poenicansa]WAS99572.1 integrase core domain-containing protein [Nannocystis poenicansa]
MPIAAPSPRRELADLYEALDARRSLSRPHVSDDNPYSEAHFKTLKYTHDYPDRFASYDDAHAFCVRFVDGYNHHHRHSGVHYGRTEAILSVRTAPPRRLRGPSRALRPRKTHTTPASRRGLHQPSAPSRTRPSRVRGPHPLAVVTLVWPWHV